MLVDVERPAPAGLSYSWAQVQLWFERPHASGSSGGDCEGQPVASVRERICQKWFVYDNMRHPSGLASKW